MTTSFRHCVGFGKRIICFNGKRKNRQTGEYTEHCHERFKKKYIANDFSRLFKV